MKKFQFSELHFDHLIKHRNQGENSVVYEDGMRMLKILTQYSSDEKEELFYKADAMCDIKIDGVIFPDVYYVMGNKVEAYSMETFVNSDIFFDYYSNYYFTDYYQILLAFQNAGRILRNIHAHDIIGNDISFSNILVNPLGELCYIDLFDSCYFKTYRSSLFISSLLYDYLSSYRGNPNIMGNDNLDRISLLLSANHLIEAKNNIMKFMMGKTESMRNIKYYISLLENTAIEEHLPNIPYLDEMISSNDFSCHLPYLKKR